VFRFDLWVLSLLGEIDGTRNGFQGAEGEQVVTHN
jgi:hypothetical protein